MRILFTVLHVILIGALFVAAFIEPFGVIWWASSTFYWMLAYFDANYQLSNPHKGGK